MRLMGAFYDVRQIDAARFRRPAPDLTESIRRYNSNGERRREPRLRGGPVTDSFSHFDERGASRMVDVSEKATSRREAVAVGTVRMSASTLKKVLDRGFAKGDVLEVARLAGIMAAKKTADLIPLCHPLPISAVNVDIAAVGPTELEVRARVATEAKTGVEMEALTAAAVACLAVYDMCKGTERGISIGPLELVSKSGGRSGAWVRSESPSPDGDAARLNTPSPDDDARLAREGD